MGRAYLRRACQRFSQLNNVPFRIDDVAMPQTSEVPWGGVRIDLPTQLGQGNPEIIDAPDIEGELDRNVVPRPCRGRQLDRGRDLNRDDDQRQRPPV